MGNGKKFSKSKIIRDPIYGYIELEKGIEIKETYDKPGLIDLPCFQRLRFVSQTPGVYYVYPGGFTSRFIHSIGTCHLAGEICKKLEFKEKDRKKVRLAALLHDIGHGPFSHVFDDFLKDIGDGRTHEMLGKEIIKLPELKEIIEGTKDNFSIDEISEIAWGVEEGKEPKSSDYLIERGIISGWLDVDKLDYLVRDSYFAGVEYGNIDVNRIINNITKFMGQIALDRRALLALEQMYIQREMMFKAVYYHKTARAWEVQLLLLLKKLKSHLQLKEILDKALKAKTTESLYQLNENYVLSKLFDIYIKEEVPSSTLSRHLKAVLFRDPKHLFKSAIESVSIPAPPESPKVRDAYCDDIVDYVNNKIGGSEKMTRDDVFIDTPKLTNKPSEIKPEGPFPLVEGDSPFNLPDDSWINKIKPKIEFTRFFTFPEYVPVCKKAIKDLFIKEEGELSSY